MATDDADPDTTYEDALTHHYAVPNLANEILEALDAAGKDIDALSRDDIASFDEFHIRGLDATRELAALADIQPGARVLDIGCGVGGPARTLAAEYNCSVTGIDIVEEYCRTAELFTNRVGLSDRVQFRHGNALDLPFETAQFDVVWLIHTLLNIPPTGPAFDEAARVLKPGGTLALYDICAGPGGDPIFPVPWAAEPSLSHLDPPEHLQEIILDRGFTEIAWRDVTEPSLEWFRNVVASMESRPADAPPPIGLNLLMGADTPSKAANVVRSLEEDRIVVVQGVFERAAEPSHTRTRGADHIDL